MHRGSLLSNLAHLQYMYLLISYITKHNLWSIFSNIYLITKWFRFVVLKYEYLFLVCFLFFVYLRVQNVWIITEICIIHRVNCREWGFITRINYNNNIYSDKRHIYKWQSYSWKKHQVNMIECIRYYIP